jgi:hypothetical protein
MRYVGNVARISEAKSEHGFLLQYLIARDCFEDEGKMILKFAWKKSIGSNWNGMICIRVMPNGGAL